MAVPVVVVILDTLRADMLDDLEVLRELPTLASLLNQSIEFTRAYSPSHWTLPAHGSLFTGLPPSRHFARQPDMKLREDIETLAEIFHGQDYLTALVTCNPYLSDLFGMTRGFEIVWTSPVQSITWRLNAVINFVSTALGQNNRFARTVRAVAGAATAVLLSSPKTDNGARAAIRYSSRLLEKSTRTPFLIVNLMEAHMPYHGRGAFSKLRERIRNSDVLARWTELTFAIQSGRLRVSPELENTIRALYWENVKYLDSQLGSFIRTIEETFPEGSLLIVTSDHGQMLGENGHLDHVEGLHEELIRVPLLIRTNTDTRQARIDYPVDITWLFSLLRSVALGEQDALESWLAWSGMQGKVIAEAVGGYVPHVQSPKVHNPTFSEDLLAFRARRDYPALACVTKEWKLICHLGRQDDELYKMGGNSLKTRDSMTQKEGLLKELHQELRKHFIEGKRPVLPSVRRDGLPLEAKRIVSEVVLTQALDAKRKSVIVWTGGKDSTLVLYLAIQVARESGTKVPPLLIVDHGQHFPETWSFIADIPKQEGLDVIVAKNENLLRAAQGAEKVELRALDTENQEEALKAGLEGEEIEVSLGSVVGNHLLKTVPLNQALRKHSFDTAITGIRWDENRARATEVFFSERAEPPHTRVHPILPWTEMEVWKFTLDNDLPIHPLYRLGYRSFDGVKDSKPTDKRPAWEQDLEASKERAGRSQDKEEIMERLRALGYF